MIDKLKFMIDECESNAKLKSILLKVAALPEDKQDKALQLIELILKAKTEG